MVAQLWDRDVFKFNDHIAEGQLDLGPYFIKAYKTRDTVKLFPKIDPKLEEMKQADVSNVCTRGREISVLRAYVLVYFRMRLTLGGSGRVAGKWSLEEHRPLLPSRAPFTISQP